MMALAFTNNVTKFQEIQSGDFELLPLFSSNNPTDKNAFGQFGWFSRVRSQIIGMKNI